ncbi:MAG: hypothetical protein IH813_04875 [Thaumarchaeota archaeon]|nr:hypothetical protein [Nitrososphaerota archaeon]GFN42133.1 MAG: conserved hypothetical protein [Marine Group I thaumarchaeote]
MRLGTSSSNEFLQSLNKKNQEIQKLYVDHIKNLTKTVQIKVMLGDSTVTDQSTFDPQEIKNFYDKIIKNLRDWSIQNITITNNEDIRRIFTKFEVREGNYILSGHLSQQFHVLLYYKPEQRVLECQKELSEIIENTKDKETELANLGDQFVINKLKELGYKDLDNQKLFEIFFNNDEVREKIYSEIEQQSDVDFRKLSKKKVELFNELDSYLMETYQTTPILIDDARLVTGEEGCLCTFDLEHIKNKNKEGLFDSKKIPQIVKQKIIERLAQIEKILRL